MCSAEKTVRTSTPREYRTANPDEAYATVNTYVTGWRLRKVIAPNGREMTFTYRDKASTTTSQATSKDITEAANRIYEIFQELLKVTKEAIK